jgi:hypothetical protein
MSPVRTAKDVDAVQAAHADLAVKRLSEWRTSRTP